MKTFKPWLLLALVFGVGVILGVAGTRLMVRRAVREALLHRRRSANGNRTPARPPVAAGCGPAGEIGGNPDRRARPDGGVRAIPYRR